MLNTTTSNFSTRNIGTMLMKSTFCVAVVYLVVAKKKDVRNLHAFT